MKNISPRLKEVATMVRCGGVIADVGTDHAYLPIYLIEHNICQKAIASDLRPGPLENARSSVEAAGLSKKIELRLSDGLDEFSPDEAGDIVIAGMGGILIAQIIEKAPWLKRPDKHLVLQPMTHAEYLRAFLVSDGYEIISENVCEDSGKLYCAMSVVFTGVQRAVPEHYEYYGELPRSADPLASEYLRRLSERYMREADKMRCSDPERAGKLLSVSKKIKSVIGQG